jgi:hypothetical protein
MDEIPSHLSSWASRLVKLRLLADAHRAVMIELGRRERDGIPADIVAGAGA